MRMLAMSLFACALVAAAGFTALAADKVETKPVTLKGTIGCSKCEYKLTDECGTAIKVKEGDKEVVYLVLDEGKAAKYHGMICTATKAGSVTGVVGMKGTQKTIKPEKDGVKFE